MVAVAVVAFLFIYCERWVRYKRLAAAHCNFALYGEAFPDGVRIAWGGSFRSDHWDKAGEFNRAAWFPWVSVEPLSLKQHELK